ncbi:MAG TPA: TolC family protein, partial [Gemmatimonadaceae bacterium]|nr:TolC family protein [Gemmatimonadaceae bacterium]
MRPFRTALALLALVFAPSLVAAQDPGAARPISLDEAVRLARQNSPITVTAHNALRTGKLNEMYAFGQFLPSIGVNASGFNTSGASFFQGQFVPYQGNPWNYSKGYSASMLLFDGGQR